MRFRKRNAFTLLELVMVVIIIGILAGLVVPRMVGKVGQARRTVAKAQIASFRQALNNFEMDMGRFPSTSEGLQALVEKPASLDNPDNWKSRYLDNNQVPEDPWGHSYIYRCPGDKNQDGYDLICAGPDGRQGTEDDITNF